MRKQGSILIWLGVALMVSACAASANTADPKIYVNTAGIDARKDLTDAQKQEVKDAMKNTIKKNLEEAFGAGNVTVTDDPKEAGSADRTVNTENTVGTGTGTGGTTTYHWGDWAHGSSSTTVHVGTYMDDPPGVSGDFKNPDGSWNTTELGRAMGTTAAHEVAHSYSAGHDDNNTNKMNKANSAGQLDDGLSFNDPAKKTLQDNNGKPPCTTVTNYSTLACIADWWDDPTCIPGFYLHEPLSITTRFQFGGPLAPMFDFGWWGIDTDNGVMDGNPWGDFVYKSSMTHTPHDSPRITFFDRWTAHFVLRGLMGTPWQGRYFDVSPGDIMLGDWVTQPDGDIVARHIDLAWNVDGLPGNDVMVAMDRPIGDPYDIPSEFSGFKLGLAPPISVAEAKMKVDGTYVFLQGKVVTAQFPAAGRFYISEPLSIPPLPAFRSGIGVMWSGPVLMHGTVHVWGKMTTNADGERQIEATDVQMLGSGEARPLGMNNRSVGGGDFHYTAGKWPSGQQGVEGGVGLNTIGLYVKVFGRVVAVEPVPEPTWFVIEDGSGGGLKIAYGPDPHFPAPNMYVTVLGVVSCEMPPMHGRPLSEVRAISWSQVFE